MVRIPPEGGVLASGTAEVGGFAASEGGEALLPGRPRGVGSWPALLELATSSQLGVLTRPR